MVRGLRSKNKVYRDAPRVLIDKIVFILWPSLGRHWRNDPPSPLGGRGGHISMTVIGAAPYTKITLKFQMVKLGKGSKSTMSSVSVVRKPPKNSEKTPDVCVGLKCRFRTFQCKF